MNIANVLGLVAGFAWAVAIGALVLVVVRVGRNRPMPNGGVLVLVLFLVAILVSVLSAGLVFINPQERGVVISAFAPKGYREAALEPGLRWIIPFAETVVRYPISSQNYTMSIAGNEGAMQRDDSIAARTSDGQEIYVDASVIYSIDPTKVVQVHIQWQDRYVDGLVRAQARGVIRDAVSQFGVEEVNSTNRFEMVQKMNEAMRLKLESNGLLLQDFVLRNIAFSDEYAASVEQKQIAEQLAQQARFTVEQRRQEAEQARQTAQGAADAAVIRAKGQAESRLIEAEAEAAALEKIAAALKDKPDLLTYEYIQKLSPNIQAMLLPSNAPFVFPLPQLNNTTTSEEITP